MDIRHKTTLHETRPILPDGRHIDAWRGDRDSVI